jgi:hypothetical protein
MLVDFLIKRNKKDQKYIYFILIDEDWTYTLGLGL